MRAGVPDLVAAAAQPKGNHGLLRDGDGGSMLFYPQTQTAGPAAARHALACPSTQRGAGRAGVTVAASDRRSSSSFKVGPRRRRRIGAGRRRLKNSIQTNDVTAGPGLLPAALRCERLCPPSSFALGAPGRREALACRPPHDDTYYIVLHVLQ